MSDPLPARRSPLLSETGASVRDESYPAGGPPAERSACSARDAISAQSASSARNASSALAPWRRLAFVFAILAVGHTLYLSRSVGCMDFLHFWGVAREVRAHRTSDIYSDEERQRLAQSVRQELAREREATADPLLRVELERLASSWPAFHTYSTPWLYTVAAGASSGGFIADQDRYQVLSILGLALAIAGMSRALGHPWTSVATLLVPLMLWFEPALTDMNVGNVNRLQLGALALYVWIGQRGRSLAADLAAGAVLGLTIAFKPNLAFVTLTLGTTWLVCGDWSKALVRGLGFAFGAAVAVAVSSSFFGSFEPWRAWWAQMGRVISHESRSDYDLSDMAGNFCLARFVPGVPPLAIAATLLVAFGLTLVLARRAGGTNRLASVELEILALGVGGAVSVLASPLAWLHYFVLVLPLALYLLRPTADSGWSGERRPAVIRNAGLVGLGLVALLPVKFFLPVGDRASAALVLLGVLGLLALALIDLLSGARGAGDERELGPATAGQGARASP